MIRHILYGILATLLTVSLALAAVNINTAGTSELETLRGIGPAKAKAIVDYRKEHGGFQSVDDLINVRGIGPKILEKIRPEVKTGE